AGPCGWLPYPFLPGFWSCDRRNDHIGSCKSPSRRRGMQIVDNRTGARAFQAILPMRDGVRLNTFVFLPGDGGPRWPVILHRTPYGITAGDAPDKTDCTRAWLPSAAEPLRGSILRGWGGRVRGGACRGAQ